MKLTIKNIDKITLARLGQYWSVYSYTENAREYQFDCVNLLDGGLRKLVLIRENWPTGHYYFSRPLDVSKPLWTKSDPYTFEDLSNLDRFIQVLAYEIDFAITVSQPIQNT